jgi:hypothetical protein
LLNRGLSVAEQQAGNKPQFSSAAGSPLLAIRYLAMKPPRIAEKVGFLEQ